MIAALCIRALLAFSIATGLSMLGFYEPQRIPQIGAALLLGMACEGLRFSMMLNRAIRKDARRRDEKGRYRAF